MKTDINKTNKYQKLLSNTLILGLGVFGSKILVFLMMPLYTGILAPEEYSLADLISQAANLLMPLACIGITDGVFRFAMDGERDKKSVLSSGLFVLLCVSAIFAALSPLLSLIEYFSAYSLLIVVYVISANLHSICAQYIRACNKTKLFAIQGILNTVFVIGFNILLLVVFEMNVLGYVLSVVLANVVTTVFLIVAGKLYKDISIRSVKLETVKSLIKYSAPMIPATIFWWITSVSDRYMVTWFRDSAENGLYSAAYKIPTMITLVSNVFIEAWQYSAVSEQEGREKFFGRVFEYYQSIIFIACSAVISLSQIFIIILCADSYFEAWRFIPVLTLSVAFSGFTSFLGSVYLVKKKSIMTFVTAMTGALVNIVLNFALIPLLGAQGAAISTCISYAVVFLIRALNTRKYVRFSLHPIRILLNTALLVAQTVCILSFSNYMILIQASFVLVAIVLNAKPFVEAIRYFVNRFSRKLKKN